MVAGFIQFVRQVMVLASRHRSLVLQNLALRQQSAVYRRTRPKPAIRWPDRLFWIGLRRAWPDWKSALVVVRPATVVAWHRRGFAWYWTHQSRRRSGRPQVGADIRRLIREMAVANPLWGAPRIHGELLKLGFGVSERTVSRLMPRRRRPPSQSWRTFLKNHIDSTVAVDLDHRRSHRRRARRMRRHGDRSVARPISAGVMTSDTTSATRAGAGSVSTDREIVRSDLPYLEYDETAVVTCHDAEGHLRGRGANLPNAA